jgi:hypothetical protein
MSEVYISYARADAATTNAIVSQVKMFSVGGWKDRADLAIGKAAMGSVRQALEQSAAVVVMISPKSLENKWVQFELGAAAALDKRIIPVIIDGDNVEAAMPEFLRKRRKVDARRKPGDVVAREIEQIVQNAP